MAYERESKEAVGLKSLQSKRYPDSNKDFQKFMRRTNSSIDYISSYMQTMQKGIDDANQNPIEQIQSFINDLIVLFGGGEPTGFEFGDLKYIIQGLGALFGLNGPFPLSLIEAAEHFFLGYVVPLDQFTDVIFDAIFAWAEELGLSEDFISTLQDFRDALETFTSEFGDLFTALSGLFGVFGTDFGSLGGIWDIVATIFDGLNAAALRPIMEIIETWSTPFVEALTVVINTLEPLMDELTDLLEAIGGASGPVGQLWTTIDTLFSGLEEAALEPILTLFTSLTLPIVEAIVNVADLLSPITDVLVELASALGPIIDVLVGIVSMFGTGSTPGSFDPTDAITNLITNFINPNTLIDSGAILGFLGSGDIGQNIQDLIDSAMQGIVGGSGTGWFMADLKQAFTVFPIDNVTGAGGLPTVRDTFGTMWDWVTGAFRLTGLTGVGLTDLANASQDVSFSSLNSSVLAGSHEVTLGYRTNNPVAGAMERTAVSNFDWTLLGNGATPANFAVTQANSVGAVIRMPNADTKGTFFWRSIYTGTVSGFYINIGKINDVTGAVDHLYQTPNIAGNLTTTWSWDYYQPAAIDRIVHGPDDGLIMEFQVVGTGTVTIAGIDFQWAGDNMPGAITRKPAITRATAGTHPTLALSAAQYTSALATKTPYIALGRADVPITYHPPEPWASVSAGAFTYPIPAFAQVAGCLIDWWIIGGGGGGQSGGYFVTAEGGSKATWNSGTFVYGTDIPLGTTALTGVIADNASGGINPFALDPGDNGTATTITALVGGFSTKSAAGGFGGGRTGNNTSSASGEAAGNSPARGGIIQFGGAAAGVNSDGNRPGGGGGSGYPAVGRQGAEGQAFFRARQP